MSIDGLGPIRPHDISAMQPLKPPSEVSADAIRATVVNQLLGAAPTIPDPTPQQQNAYYTTRAFADLAQIYLLLSSGISDGKLQGLWNDLSSIVSKLYNGNVTTIGGTTYNPQEMVKKALLIKGSTDITQFKGGFWAANLATSGPALFGSNCIAAFLFNKDANFDMNFNYSPTSAESLLNMLLLAGVTSMLKSGSEMRADVFALLSNFWNFQATQSPWSMGEDFAKALASALYIRDVVNGTGLMEAKMKNYNDDLQRIASFFTADPNQWPNPDFRKAAFDAMARLTAPLRQVPPKLYTSWDMVAINLGAAGLDPLTLLSDEAFNWVAFRTPR